MAGITIDTREAERTIKALRGLPKGMNANILEVLRESAKIGRAHV